MAAVLTVAAACQKQEIMPYDVDDSAICFGTSQIQFSLRYYSEAEPTLKVPVRLVGPVTDYDRTIPFKIVESSENNAAEGKDFSIDSALVRAGETSGAIYMKVAALEGQDSRRTRIKLLPSDDFTREFDSNSTADIVWTAGYTRPESYAWRSWYLFFSPYYSAAFHKVVCECLGDEVDMYTHFSGGRNEGYTLKVNTWWYSANAILRNFVASYDKEHPDEPLMHSPDVMRYNSQYAESGTGTVPTTIPTIFETLVER